MQYMIHEVFENKTDDIRQYLKEIATPAGQLRKTKHKQFLSFGDTRAILVERIMMQYNISLIAISDILQNDLESFDDTCPVCGKPIDLSYRLKFTCGSKECLAKNPSREAKRMKTNLERYGTEHSWQAESVKEKIHQTNLKRYGVEYSWQAEEVKQKIRDTNMSRYGAVSAMQSEEVKRKVKETTRERYGVDHHMQLDSVKGKVRQTCLSRYGVENPYQSANVQEKIRLEYLEKYGAEYPSQIPSIKAKIRQACIEHYGVAYNLQAKEVRAIARKTMLRKYREENRQQYLTYLAEHRLEQLSSEEEYLESETLKFKCLECGETFECSIFCNFKNIRCQNHKPEISLPEKEVYDFMVSLVGEANVRRHDRSVLRGHKELDIYLPNHKIAIEFDGIYWHSSYRKDRNYHVYKTLECIDKGIRLIHIFENEWLYKKDIVKSILCSILGIYHRIIPARKCEVRNLDNSEYIPFLNNNHLQGYTAASIKLGLFYNNELAACIGIGKSRFATNEMELIRFCTAKNTLIIGGLSRLIKHANIHNLVSYVDLRYYTGQGYQRAGFHFLYRSEPSYIYAKGNSILSRFQCQKHKLPDLLGDKFIPELNEEDNMEINGYTKIYDCGTLKYALPAAKS